MLGDRFMGVYFIIKLYNLNIRYKYYFVCIKYSFKIFLNKFIFK